MLRATVVGAGAVALPFTAWCLWRGQVPFSAWSPVYVVMITSAVLYHLTGLTAGLVVKNRRWGVHNENAMFRKEVTAEEVRASRLVCYPLHLWMLCSPNEGAAAIVLRTVLLLALAGLVATTGLRHEPGTRDAEAG